MEIVKRFFDYAQAFEHTYMDDDWSRLKPFFTPDAVYLPGDGQEIGGREHLLEHLKHSVDTLDRRFDTRRPELVSGPEVSGNVVTIRWRATYTKDKLPDLVLSGIEVASFEGDEISRLEDILDDGVAEAVERWMTEYGDRLATDRPVQSQPGHGTKP